ncbi:MAG: MFS transporter, partial [Thermoanaerobaculaceae bacterium]|nr:MFS transporter [Thermoanaerobaculaceae bacterium]
RSWRNSTVFGFSLASFLSDASHEMATAVLPLYLRHLGLGASVLGLIEGVADLSASGSKWVGGAIGQRTRHKKALTATGYAVTSVCVGAFALVTRVVPFLILRAVAWASRGFRGPLRDTMMAESVDPENYGKAYGLERAGDMAGAVVGPLAAVGLLAVGTTLPRIFLWTLVPGLGAALAVALLVREPHADDASLRSRPLRPSLPRRYWGFLAAVLLFGMGDFSRTFLIFEAASRMPASAAPALLSIPVLLYVGHNLVSGLATVPAGALTDRWSYGRTLLLGYALGLGFNLGLAFLPGGLGWLLPLFAASGVYIAIEETVEKATAARMIAAEARSYALGMLATANAVGDLTSSLLTGFLLDHAGRVWAYGIAAVFSAAGVLTLAAVIRSSNGGSGRPQATP